MTEAMTSERLAEIRDWISTDNGIGFRFIAEDMAAELLAEVDRLRTEAGQAEKPDETDEAVQQ